jgi:hypothetical protein
VLLHYKILEAIDSAVRIDCVVEQDAKKAGEGHPHLSDRAEL